MDIGVAVVVGGAASEGPPAMTAHVVASQVPALLAWSLAGVSLAGVIVAVALSGIWRRIAVGVALVTTLVNIALPDLIGRAPAAPFVSVDVRLSGDPNSQHTPLWIGACGHTAAGGEVTVPGGGRIVVVGVDGRTLQEGSGSTFLLALPAGRHRVSIDVVDSGHRAYAPPLHAEIGLTVGSPGAPREPAACAMPSPP